MVVDSVVAGIEKWKCAEEGKQMLELVSKAIHHPDKIVVNLGKRGYLRWMSDERYLKLLYRMIFKKKLNLENPQTYNEKLQWLKLHDRNPLYTKMVDKYEVKQYVANLIGEEYTIPTLGVWDSVDEIDFESLPNQFVLKCTHDSGGGWLYARTKADWTLTRQRKS